MYLYYTEYSYKDSTLLKVFVSPDDVLAIHKPLTAVFEDRLSHVRVQPRFSNLLVNSNATTGLSIRYRLRCLGVCTTLIQSRILATMSTSMKHIGKF